MDTLCIPARPALQKFYRVAGRFLLVDAHDEWSADVISHLFDGWHFSPIETEHAPSGPDASPAIKSLHARPQIPPNFQSYELPGDGLCHTNGAAFLIEFGDSLIALTGDCSAEVGIWFGESLKDNFAAQAGVISFAVSAALRRGGVFELHSGGVSHPESRKSALIIGASGSGKSTLTLSLALEGWGYLSDDVLLLRECEGWIKAWGLRRDFAVTEETLQASRIPQLDAEARTAFDSTKRRLSPAELFPAGHVETCAPTTLFFPVITGEATSRVRELSQSEAMTRLIRMCPWATYDQCSAASHLRVLARLAKQCTSFEALAGRDLLSDTSPAAKLFLPRMLPGQN